MSDPALRRCQALPLDIAQRLDPLCDGFEDAWRAGQQPQIEDYLEQVPPQARSLLLRELLELELFYRQQQGEVVACSPYRQRFARDIEVVNAVFGEDLVHGPIIGHFSRTRAETAPYISPGENAERPACLGRNQVMVPLGRGGFGIVYRGYDEELRRDVAIKVAHRHLADQQVEAEAYRAEARIPALLDHPNIVPVHDVGQTADGWPFSVSKLIEGSDLAHKIQDGSPSVTEAAELVATIAEALHHAHRQGLVHRDIKPANILLDVHGKPYLVDFGLALREEDFGNGAGLLGTLAYMSPEQARREGHRVDGRSDIFSLEVVFYELLTGRRPFKGSSREELLEQIICFEPRPPRQYDDTIPKELENTKNNAGPCLQAASALASYAASDSRWEQVRGDVAARLTAENSLVLGKWAEALKPVRRQLLVPLAAILQEEGHGAAERRTLTSLYADYAEDQPDALAFLEQVLAEEADAGANQYARLALTRRQANAAVALAARGHWEKIWPLLRHTPDPTLRSYLIDRLGPGGASVQPVTDRLRPGQETDGSIKRALVLALAEFDKDRLPPTAREVLALYRVDPDPGLHGAVSCLLRQWGQEEKVRAIDRGLATGKVEGSRQWYVTGQGQTLIVLPPGEVEMKDATERVRLRCERRVALAAREVTVEGFLRFRKEAHYDQEYARTQDCPMNRMSWYRAAEYCNWLCEQEGIPEDQRCYVPNEQGQYAEGMRLAPNWQDRTGDRLPTEAEWEYACRAGSVTLYSLGDDVEDLLGKYAWFQANASSQSHPIGLLRPNDWGFFDLHGNVWK